MRDCVKERKDNEEVTGGKNEAKAFKSASDKEANTLSRVKYLTGGLMQCDLCWLSIFI